MMFVIGMSVFELLFHKWGAGDPLTMLVGLLIVVVIVIVLRRRQK